MYCSFFLNHLLYLMFFGDWHNHSFLPFELIHSTKKTKLIHIGSCNRLIKMTEINELSPFSVMSWNELLGYNENSFIAGKAIVMDGITYAEVVGYVIDECKETVTIRLDSNEVNENVVLLRPQYNKERGMFVYLNEPTSTYKWVEYHPIRMKIHKRGQIYFTVNRVQINKDDDVIVKI